MGRGALQNTTQGGTFRYGSGNTAVGERALYLNSTGRYNTAIGRGALRDNTTGYTNTAVGASALRSNTGRDNTAVGYGALRSNTDSFNTATGVFALISNTSGTRNTAVGYRAGIEATTGHDNLYLGSGALGEAGEGNTIRIGGATGTGFRQQNRTFIAGIYGITIGADATFVGIDSNGQLGTTSSSRAVKQDIGEIGGLAGRLLNLRPVAFRYKVHAEADPSTPLQFGLIAEEVAEVFPELAVYDMQGRAKTVKYHLLAPLLLNELQRQERELAAQREELAVLRQRLESGESPRPASPRRPWRWRQGGGAGNAP